jgi:hypothetical protein
MPASERAKEADSVVFYIICIAIDRREISMAFCLQPIESRRERERQNARAAVVDMREKYRSRQTSTETNAQ